MAQPHVIIYTDGSCKSDNRGGYAALMVCGPHHLEVFGAASETTNNRMELMAVIESLAKLDVSCFVEIISDSRYVVNGINGHLDGWIERGWRTKAKQPVKNQDLWTKIAAFKRTHRILARWVKGHNDNNGNEYADYLAQRSADRMTA